MHLTHYILIRRDMPLGVVCAQITHAAGESFAALIDDIWPAMPGSGTVAVVLGVRDEKQLRFYARRLAAQGVEHIEVHENAGYAAGQMTAIGCYPTFDRERVRAVVKKLMPISEVTV